MAFEEEIKLYESLRCKYQALIINKMDREEYTKYNEVLFSTHSCAIEGNSFSVDDSCGKNPFRGLRNARPL